MIFSIHPSTNPLDFELLLFEPDVVVQVLSVKLSEETPGPSVVSPDNQVIPISRGVPFQ